MNRVPQLARFLVTGVVLLAGCGDESNAPGEPLEGLAPDFTLGDVNPNSATFDSTVSPRDYLEKVSAWYFGHST